MSFNIKKKVLILFLFANITIFTSKINAINWRLVFCSFAACICLNKLDEYILTEDEYSKNIWFVPVEISALMIIKMINDANPIPSML